jgi:hypothetical protein
LTSYVLTQIQHKLGYSELSLSVPQRTTPLLLREKSRLKMKKIDGNQPSGAGKEIEPGLAA